MADEESPDTGDASMFNNYRYSDVTILLRGTPANANDSVTFRQIPAHRAILSEGSSFFKKALEKAPRNGRFMVLCFTEKYPASFWRGVEFAYKGTFSEEPLQSFLRYEDQTNEVLRYFRAYNVGKRFRMDEYTTLALGKLSETLRRGRFNINSVVECIREAYLWAAPAGDDMKGVLVRFARHYLDKFMKNGQFKELMSCGGVFVVDLLTSKSPAGLYLAQRVPDDDPVE